MPTVQVNHNTHKILDLDCIIRDLYKNRRHYRCKYYYHVSLLILLIIIQCNHLKCT